MKKIFSLLLLTIAAVALVACKKDEAKKPVITGVGSVTIDQNSTFDPRAGVKATDEKDGDLTSKIEIEGTVDTAVIKVHTLTYKVKNSANLETTATRNVTVVAAQQRANGTYNFKFAEPAVRNAFFGAAEKYLLDNVYGGVPLFSDAGMSIYDARVSLPTETYVPVMGFGTSRSTLTKDDSQVKMPSTGLPGAVGEFTWRGSFSSNPTTFNHWTQDDSVSSDAINYFAGSLYDFNFTEDKKGYQIEPSMAKSAPQPSNPRTEGSHTVSKVWTVEIKDGLKWGFANAVPAAVKDNPLAQNITAQSFVDTFKFALDNKWFRAIAGGGHFWATSNTIVGAKEYYDAKAEDKVAKWEDFGIKVVDGNKLQFTFAEEMSEWNVSYWLSSSTLSPVNLVLLNSLEGSNDAEKAKKYGTSPATIASSGAYILETYVPDKLLRYSKNNNYVSKDQYKFTGYEFAIIQLAETIFAEFEAGKLDAAGIPLTKYDQYKNNAGVRRTPGSTTFRMNINGLGTQEAQNALFPNSGYAPEAILANIDFRKALYYGLDRGTLAYNVLKTREPIAYLFSNAYLVDPQTGVAFRDTEAGKKVGADLAVGTTHAYNKDAAVALFKKAVKEEIAKGNYKNGDTIELEVLVQAASTAQAQMGAFIKSQYEAAFNDAETGVKVTIKVTPTAFPGIYYDHQMVGKFDLASGGISGSTLDASSFLEVFSSDNRGGFTINWGFDTSVADILVKYQNSENLEVEELWSFDAIVRVLNGEVTVKDGKEVIDTSAATAVVALINALPAVEAVTLAHEDAINDAYDAYSALSPRQAELVTNVAKLYAVLDKLDTLTDRRDADKVIEKIDLLPAKADVTAANQEAIEKARADYAKLTTNGKKLVLADKLAKLTDAETALVVVLINELPEVVSLDDAADVAGLRAKFKALSEANALLVTNVAKLETAEAKLVDLRIVALYNELFDAETEKLVVVLSNKGDIVALNTAKNALTDGAKAKVTEGAKLDSLLAELKPLVDADEAAGVTASIEGLVIADLTESDKVIVEDIVSRFNALSAEAKLLVTEANYAKLSQAATKLSIKGLKARS